MTYRARVPQLTPPHRFALKIAGSVLAVFFAALFAVIYFYFNPFVRQKLMDAVSEGSGGLYVLEIGKVYCNPLTGYARLQQVWLRTDTVLLHKLRQEHPGKSVSQIDLRMDNFYIRGAQVWASYRSKDLELGRLMAMNPQLRWQTFRDSAALVQPETDSLKRSFLERLPGLLSPYANSVHLKRLTLVNGSIFHEANALGTTARQQADSVELVLENIYLSEKKPRGTDRALYTDDVRLRFKNYQFRSSGSPYAFAVGAGEVSSAAQNVLLTSVSAGPVVGDDEFTGQQKFRRARFRLDVKSLQINRLDFFKAIHQGALAVQTIELGGGTLDILVDKRVERVLNKKMPQEMMRSLGFPITVDSILIKNLDIALSERKASGTGTLHFSNTYAKVINFSNDMLRMTDTTPAYIYASCQLMGKGQVDLTIRLPLHDKGFNCSYQAELSAMPMAVLNPFFEKDNIAFEDGEMKHLTMQVSVNNGFASGRMDAVYSDLKLTLRSADDQKKRQVISLLANMLIRSDNKSVGRSSSEYSGDISYQRVPGDEFFRFLWRTARVGLLDILLPRVNVPLPPD